MRSNIHEGYTYEVQYTRRMKLTGSYTICPSYTHISNLMKENQEAVVPIKFLDVASYVFVYTKSWENSFCHSYMQV